jgi:hypothetical protein
MNNCCTIISSNHLYKARALYDSLKKNGSDVVLHVLVTDSFEKNNSDKHLIFYRPEQLAHLENFKTISDKYASHHDKFRWTLKPLFLQYLLEAGCEKVIYTDADIYFFNAYDFLFELLTIYRVLLTPHHYPTDPTKDQNWFEANFRVGLFNAGFIGVNTKAIYLLKWWAASCTYRCEKNAFRGTFDDQKYLDLLPVMDENVHIVRHKGCNIADWNASEIPRSIKNNDLVLADAYPLIFIHFNNTTIRTIATGGEPLLKPYLQQYMKNLEIYKPGIRLQEMYSNDSVSNRIKYKIWKFMTDAGL